MDGRSWLTFLVLRSKTNKGQPVERYRMEYDTVSCKKTYGHAGNCPKKQFISKMVCFFRAAMLLETKIARFHLLWLEVFWDSEPPCTGYKMFQNHVIQEACAWEGDGMDCPIWNILKIVEMHQFSTQVAFLAQSSWLRKTGWIKSSHLTSVPSCDSFEGGMPFWRINWMLQRVHLSGQPKDSRLMGSNSSA